MPEFTTTYRVGAPLQWIVDFHQDTRALRVLSPPPMWVQLHRVDPLAEGSISKFTLWFGLIPIRWTAVHSQVNRLSGFIDSQAAGPMLSWKHQHQWTSVGERSTQMTEKVIYEHKPGLKGIFTRILFSRLALSALFFYRRLVINWLARKAFPRSSVSNYTNH